MRTILCLSLVLLAASAAEKADEKPKQDKRSLEVLQNGFYGNLGGISVLNSGYSGIKSGLSGLGTVSTTITPAISYNSGSEFLSQAAFGQESSLFPSSYSGGIVTGGSERLSTGTGSFGSGIVASTSIGGDIVSGGNVVYGGSLGNKGLVSGSTLGSGILYDRAQSFNQGSVITSPGYYNLGSRYGVGNGFVSSLGAGSGLVKDTHSYRHYTQHVPVGVPQPVPITITQYQAIPQPVQVSVPKPYTVPVHVRVPVEVPKPYAVKVPHKVPVAVPVKVPVEVPRPYAVYHTKEVKVEVEKPVFVKEPITVKYPVPKPYYVEVPTPVKVSVPHHVVIKEPQVVSTVSHHNIASTIGNSQVSNLGSFDTISGINQISGISGINGIQSVGSDFSTLGDSHVVSGINGIQQGVSGISSDFSNFGVSEGVGSISTGSGTNGIYGITSDFGISSFPSFEDASSGVLNEEKESIAVESKTGKESKKTKTTSGIKSGLFNNKDFDSFSLEGRSNFQTEEKSDVSGVVSSSDVSVSDGPVVLAIGGVSTISPTEVITTEQVSTENSDNEASTVATFTTEEE